MNVAIGMIAKSVVLVLILISFGSHSQAASQSTLPQSEYLVIEIGESAKSVDWHPKNSIVASAHGNKISIWNTQDGTLISQFEAYSNDTTFVSWNYDGTYIASLGNDILNGPLIARIWDGDSYELLSTLNAARVLSLDWNPHNDLLILTSNITEETRVFSLWDIHSGENIANLDFGEEPRFSVLPDREVAAIWTGDGQILGASSYGLMEIWDTDDKRTITDFIGISDNSGSYLGSELGFYQSLDWSPHTNRLAFTSYLNLTPKNYQIWIWEVNPPQFIAALTEQAGHINAVEWSAHGEYLASASHDNTVHIWGSDNSNHYESLAEFHHNDIVTSVSWSPDGTQLASGSWDGTIRVWEIPQAE